MLTVDNAHAYLLDQGLISAGAVTEGDIEISSATRRNSNLQVTSSGGSNYLIKQPSDRQSEATHTLRREALFYAYCQEEPAVSRVESLLARLIYVDYEQAVLVLELLRHAVPLSRHYDQSTPTEFPVATAGAIGRALGLIHRTFQAPEVLGSPQLGFLEQGTPWVLQVHRPTPHLLADLSAANLELVRVLQADPDVGAQLDELRLAWQPQTVIHGDVRMDNFLVVPASDGAAGSVLYLVDWELVQVGDPAWDVAGALHDFVVLWVLSMPNDAPLSELVAAARHPFSVMRPAIAALWRNYCQVQGLTPGPSRSLLERTVRFSAARVIQAACEMAAYFPIMPPPAVLLLQIGVNLLADPEIGQRKFYGLGAEEAP